MEERVDLERNLEELEEYTEREAARELALLERHLINIYRGDKVAFCLECVRKHLLNIGGLAGECLEGSCRPQKVWKDLSIWTTEAEKKLTEIGPGKDITLDITRKARDFRKLFLEEIDKLKKGEGEIEHLS